MVPALLAGCDAPLSTLAPAGPAAAAIAALWWAMLAGAGLVTVFVLGLVALGFRRARRPVADRVWLQALGLGLPGVVLAVLVGAGIAVGEGMQPGAPGVLRVEAIARQWEWRFRQPGPGGATVETEGRLYIPAGQPVEVSVTSEDVIHAFWVPRLAGKIDALPGRVTRLMIEAEAPGLYHGRSAEFSGPGYAGMRFEVVAYPPDAPPAEMMAAEMTAAPEADNAP